MPPKKKRNPVKKRHRERRRKIMRRRWLLLAVLALSMLATGLYLRQQIAFYYATYLRHAPARRLTNSAEETARIQRIMGSYAGKTFGMDISHYQRPQDIRWDSLSVANRSIPLSFVVLRATMGNRSADKNFQEFWRLAKEHSLIRGAYHFYRADEDPVVQANNFLASVKLESGDLPPILDIEKIPRRKSPEKLVQDLRIWCRIVEEAYGKKPVIYTYYHYYKDYLRGSFPGHPLWLANYNDVPQPSPEDPWDFWQFTENGIVHGVATKVDLDIYNGSTWSLRRLTLD